MSPAFKVCHKTDRISDHFLFPCVLLPVPKKGTILKFWCDQPLSIVQGESDTLCFVKHPVTIHVSKSLVALHCSPINSL